jgi:VWFA-related protein
MKLRCILFFAVLTVVCGLALAQAQQSPELPSAPSATKEEERAAQRPAPGPVERKQDATKTAAPAATPEPAAGEGAATETAAPPVSQPASAAAQERENKPNQADTNDADDSNVATIRKIVNEVNVVFTVTDKHGRFVKDLKQQDFRILDDKRPAKEIRTFRTDTDLPLQVGLLIDASNSVRDRFRFEQEAAIEFLNQIVRPGYDKAFVIGFDTTPEVTQDFTDNSELLSRGVHSLRAGGGTAMYDALYFACRDKLLKAPRTGPVRRAVILLSDGQDNQSRVTREEAIEMAQRAEVIVYTISTNVSGVKQQGDKILERIAEATGGRPFFPFQMTDVANAFAEIQDELRSQYLLAYIPEDFQADGRFRTIEILASQKQFHVRARRGYYAPSR